MFNSFAIHYLSMFNTRTTERRNAGTRLYNEEWACNGKRIFTRSVSSRFVKRLGTLYCFHEWALYNIVFVGSLILIETMKQQNYIF